MNNRCDYLMMNMDQALTAIFLLYIPCSVFIVMFYAILCCFHVFRLVYDRETGKPKGYGFCEYKDQETALSAMRNLNGCEISGRSLRVDNACTEKSRLEMQCQYFVFIYLLFTFYPKHIDSKDHNHYAIFS